MTAYSKEMLCNVQMSRQPAFNVVGTTGNRAAPSQAAMRVQKITANPEETCLRAGSQANRQLHTRAMPATAVTGRSLRAGGTTMAMNMP